MSESIDEVYFDWLRAKAFIDGRTFVNYERLLWALYEVEYIWLLVGDDNRLEEGLELRREFARVIDLDPRDAWIEGPCSVLEMLIAFSGRIGFHTGESSCDWFWELIGNLGLSELDDDRFDVDYFLEAVNAFVWRTYRPDGVGGLFPRMDTSRDQRDIEVWYQFFGYLTEKEA